MYFTFAPVFTILQHKCIIMQIVFQSMRIAFASWVYDQLVNGFLKQVTIQ